MEKTLAHYCEQYSLKQGMGQRSLLACITQSALVLGVVGGALESEEHLLSL